MLKFFLVGWVCVGAMSNETCVRMGSEVIHETYQECNEYYQAVTQNLQDLKDVTLKFTCVQAGLLEDL